MEIIQGKATKDTAMELDSEGAAYYEQLKELVHKECDKHDPRYVTLKQKYKQLESDISTWRQQQKTCNRGASPLQPQTLAPPRKTNQKGI